MKKLLLVVIALTLIPSHISKSYAQENNHTASEEAEGKIIWESFQNKETSCEKLSDEDFGALGEYFMGQMVGDSHEAMNTMMERMMGKEGEEQMHIVVGKRLSGCQSDAQIPQSGVGFMPMMGFGILGWLPMLLFWIVLILGVVALFRYLSDSKKVITEKSPLDILKERYAKGEIDKKEFEQMK